MHAHLLNSSFFKSFWSYSQADKSTSTTMGFIHILLYHTAHFHKLPSNSIYHISFFPSFLFFLSSFPSCLSIFLSIYLSIYIYLLCIYHLSIICLYISYQLSVCHLLVIYQISIYLPTYHLSSIIYQYTFSYLGTIIWQFVGIQCMIL